MKPFEVAVLEGLIDYYLATEARLRLKGLRRFSAGAYSTIVEYEIMARWRRDQGHLAAKARQKLRNSFVTRQRQAARQRRKADS